MTGDDVRAVTLFFLQLFQVDTKPLESTEGAQRYRIAQKIVDALKVKPYSTSMYILSKLNLSFSEKYGCSDRFHAID